MNIVDIFLFFTSVFHKRQLSSYNVFKNNDKCKSFVYGSEIEKKSIALSYWNEARNILSMDNLNIEKVWNTDFFNIDKEKSNCGVITYKDTYKCANNFIQFNMVNKCNAHVYKSNDNYKVTDSTVFTFVREPLKHFESAYREVAWQFLAKCIHLPNNAHPYGLSTIICADLKSAQQSEKVARAILTDFLNGNKREWLYDHFSLMTAFSFSKFPYPT